MDTKHDAFMQLWIAIPESRDSVLYTLKDGVALFDINEPIVKGVVSFGAGEMPFICIRPDLGTNPVPETVITHFRHGKEWLTTVVGGKRPSFLLNDVVQTHGPAVLSTAWTPKVDSLSDN